MLQRERESEKRRESLSFDVEKVAFIFFSFFRLPAEGEALSFSLFFSPFWHTEGWPRALSPLGIKMAQQPLDINNLLDDDSDDEEVVRQC